jgi:sigma-B regulation protein RsbU (phosphoserine phosphatase)
MKAELEEARDLQLSLCPQVFPAPTPERPVEIFGVLQPAREVGGDFYDFFYRDDGTLCVVVGDVAGKGAPAALFAARARDITRLEGMRRETPAEVVEAVNRVLSEANPTITFVTLFVAVLSLRSGALSYTNAGHNSPLICSPDLAISELCQAKGPPIGIDGSVRYESAGAELANGDLLFVFTDGVTEMLDHDGDFFGEERLRHWLTLHAAAGPRKATTAILNAVSAFAGGAEPADDITALAIRRVQVG